MEPVPTSDRIQLPRNMIENSMFEEEPDVVDLAKEPGMHPLEPDEMEYEPRSSRLLVRGLGEHDMDEDEEDYESSAKLLGMSFMNRSTGLRINTAGYRQNSNGSCSVPSVRTMVLCAVVLTIAVSVIMAIYLLPKCTFTKEGCHKENHTMEQTYPLATNGKVFPWANIRLPNAVVPVHYDIVLQPNLSTMVFSGSVQITVQACQDTSHIILHSSKLNITKATLASSDSRQPKQVEFLEYPINDQIAILAPEGLHKGQKYTINMEYSSDLSDTYFGFYRVAYKNANSTPSWLAATQFEPLAARMAFPCFDEPALKATFQIKVKREKQHSALSNMPKKATIPVSDGIVQDEFSVSLKMSTYLVAVIVGDLANINATTNKGTLVSVYAVPQKLKQATYALEAAVKLLEFYHGYFYIAYPLKKLDLVAIPDFQAGAMENWGLITFRETTLLLDDKTSSATDKKRVTRVIAHELAHQWFGNLVTMEWWNDLWLNEGFATFMEHFAAKQIFPDLFTDEDFLNIQLGTMEKDSMNSSHPISLAVESPEQIEEMFDAVSYGKGASLLLMLQNYLSEDVFQAGIEIYLHNHSYGSIRNDDLWDSLSEGTNGTVDVKMLMKTWTLQKGFPLVTVTRKGKCVHLRQERFVHSVESENQTFYSSYLWHIPLSYTTNSITFFSSYAHLLNQTSDTIELKDEVEWIKFNANSNGYYIVQYSKEDWDILIQLLKRNHTALSSRDRANLIHNVFSLAGIGQVSLATAFDLIDYLVKENSNAPITQALYQMSLIYNLVEKRGMQKLADKVLDKIEKLLGDKIRQQAWTNNGTLPEQELRSSLLTFACSHNLGGCNTTADELFHKWKDSTGAISLPPDVMSIIFAAGAKTEIGWKFLLDKYLSSVSEPEKLKILEALASTEDVRNLIWLMQTGLEGRLIRSQDLSHILTKVSQNLPGHLVAWDFVKENWEQLKRKFHVGSYTIQNIVTRTTCQFSSPEHLLEVKTFFESKSEETAQLRFVQEAIERIQLNIQWMETNLVKLEKLL